MLVKSSAGGVVTLTIKCAPTMVSGKENVVEVTLVNNGESSVEVTPYGQLKGFAFTVLLNKRECAPTMLYRSWSNDVVRGRDLPPTLLTKGQESKLLLNFTRLFDLSVPGDYEITVNWIGMLAGQNTKVEASIQPFNVTVIEEAPAFPR